jgi:hypothetical protein
MGSLYWKKLVATRESLLRAAEDNVIRIPQPGKTKPGNTHISKLKILNEVVVWKW